MLTLHMGFAIPVDFHMQRHRVTADRTVLDVVLVRAGGDVHWHDDLFATRVADVRGLKVGGWPFAASVRAFLGHGIQKCTADMPTPSRTFSEPS